jgi:serine/threonine protein kinase
MPSSMPPFAPGSRVGPYELLAPLGAGGMGEVWRARDRRLGRELALKRVLSDHVSDRDRIWREARIAANLSHPNICKIFDVLEQEDEIFLAFELLEGETLDARLARGPLAAGEAVEQMIVILAALGALHAHGFLHRDLKPANIFCTAHGPKLLDFGLARQMEEATGSEPRITRTGVAVGTPRYMSPE